MESIYVKTICKRNIENLCMDKCKSIDTLINQEEKFSKDDGVDKFQGYLKIMIGLVLLMT